MTNNADGLDGMENAKLNEVFSVEVAQTQPEWHVFKRGLYYRPGGAGYTSDVEQAGRFTEAEAKCHEYPHDEPVTIKRIATPPFCTDANAVLPWLEKWVKQTGDGKFTSACSVFVSISVDGYHVEMGEFKARSFSAKSETFARAAVIALTRASRAKKAGAK